MLLETNFASAKRFASKKSGDFKCAVNFVASVTIESMAIVTSNLAFVTSPLTENVPVSFLKLPSCLPSFLLPMNFTVVLSAVSLKSAAHRLAPEKSEADRNRSESFIEFIIV